APRHPRPLHHVGHGGGGITLLGHHLGHGVDEPAPLGGHHRLAGEAVTAAREAAGQRRFEGAGGHRSKTIAFLRYADVSRSPVGMTGFPTGFLPYSEGMTFVDADHPDVVAFAARATAGAGSDREKAVALFYAVRDGIRYDPYALSGDPETYRASAVLRAGAAYCIPKAVLLCAAARAAGLTARLGFADVRNHLNSE